MQCPKCGSEFAHFTHEAVSVDRCGGCGGLWIDALELIDRERIKAYARIDTGSKRVGKSYNAVRNIECPKCAVKMLTMADRTQSHIEFESCPSCSGSFFDAGEFKDLSVLSIVERCRKTLNELLPVR